MRVSYFKLSTYLRCELQYRFRYVERIPSRPKAHFRFGSVLHSVNHRGVSVRVLEEVAKCDIG